MSTPWREAAGDKATAEGYECFHIKQRGRRAECDAYLSAGTWPESWPGPTPVKAKGAPAVDDMTIPFDFGTAAPAPLLTPEAPAAPAPPNGGEPARPSIEAAGDPPELAAESLPEILPEQKTDARDQAAVVVEPNTGEPVKAAYHVKAAYQVGKPKEKQKVLPNGRTKKPMPSFGQWHCRIFPKDIAYPAWRYLTKTATDVANICRAKRDYAAAMGKKDSAGLPVFQFTGSEAVTVFKLTRPTFIKAMHLLIEIGFIKYSMRGDLPMRGGIVNGAGISAQYVLSEEWKSWEPPKRDNSNISKARSAKQNPRKGALIGAV
ncbi:MAG: hypothetical protein A2075_23345 [Geobacteraceae bacterium GWC2_58_44]|nr:MAG: hypothetical protein A2075_23345 [Geobacteraceae bacterium GWC2_58_44]